MPMRRTIGISLACLVTSACASAETPEESTVYYSDESTGATPGSAEIPTDGSRSLTCGAAEEGRSTGVGSQGVEQQHKRSGPVVTACSGISEPCCVRLRAAGSRQFGKAVWYNFVGRKTASGEILDTVTATAAHRSLPLASYAKVTNLGNGSSVIVKINDRGPFGRGRVLDLSPRAADVLDMKRAGVVAVIIEPLITEAAPTVALFQNSDTAVAQ